MCRKHVRSLHSALFGPPPPDTIETWAEAQNAQGFTPQRVANSNEMPGNKSCYPQWVGTCPMPLADLKAAEGV